MSSNRRLCNVVQPILRWGMVLSMVMMLVGLTLGVISGTESTKALSLERIPSGILELEPMAFLSLGIVLLIVTPLARVFGALCVFIREGDRKFILISLVVLTAVTVAVLLGAA